MLRYGTVLTLLTVAIALVSMTATAADTLLLTEIVVTPTGGEMIEIHNPTAATIDLSDVYLTDATYAPSGIYYYNIVTGANAGGGSSADFHARFPAGATIAAGAYQTIALNGSANFVIAYGVDPTYELYEDAGSPDAIPDMREALSGSIAGQGGLSNDGEVVILYTWDGTSDLVQDLDYVLWGDKAEAVDKTGVSIDGPDAGTETSTYLNDIAVASQDVVASGSHTVELSWQRFDLEEGSEAASGGNGATSHDETSENLGTTWLEGEPNPGSAAPAARLLLGELVVQPTAGEYIEIFNPNPGTIDLSNYYLTDATFAGGSTYYYNIVTGANAGGGTYADFNARFPSGASIAGGASQTIALNGSTNFFTTYGVDPDYELYEDDGSPDAIPDMREALSGSINGQGGLSNDGEVVILYWWDGESDLVTDVDYALWGDKVEAVDKTGVAIDGPDPGTDTSTYLPDTAIAGQDVISTGGHLSGESFKRSNPSEGTETRTGGNGIGGNDETSENLSVTWSTGATPNPGESEPLGWVINEVLADPASDLTGDANGDGVRDATEDEFVEIINTSGTFVDISGWTLSDSYAIRHTFPIGTQIPDGCGVLVFGGGTPTGSFGDMLVQVSTTGAFGLNNDGDSVILSDGITDWAAMTYGTEGGDDQSLTLDPDVTGTAYVKHSLATGSGGALFSPGTRIDGSSHSGCVPPPDWVINEIHADPDATLGDANGDGVVDLSDDEMVEIINTSGGDLDIGGWTLSDGTAVRHTFLAGTIVSDGCGIVVFGGGTPSGALGACIAQVASTGSLDLDDSGDTITLDDGGGAVASVTYGAEGGDNQSLTLDPDITGLAYVKHSLATGSGGALFSSGTRVDGSYFLGCPLPAMEIYDIQGSGLTTPYAGYTVTTNDNIVTAVGPEGFFIQTPDARADASADTSNGIYVFTTTAPTVAVGDLVDVSGVVEEFYDFTEITLSGLLVHSSGNPLPSVVTFDATRPSPDPTTPSCSGQEYECYEGMLVTITDGIVCGPNQRFGVDPIAEIHITAGSTRCLREKGVEYPGWPAPPVLPVWDGNPEVFELDPDRLGLANQVVPAGSVFDATGPLGYEYGGYELWPTSFSFTPATLPLPVRDRVAGELTIASFNMYRMYDDVDDPGSEDDSDVIPTAEYERRLDKLSQYIRTVLKAPDIIGVQEVEHIGVLGDLAAKILLDDASLVYTGQLVEGNDGFGMDVGFLVRDSVAVDSVTQLGAAEIYSFPGHSDSLLHDRPPLLLEGRYLDNGEPFALAVMVNHTRSQLDIAEPTSDGEWRRQKRLEQAQSIAQKAQGFQTSFPDTPLIVIGDLNAGELTDSFVDVVGQIAGDFDPADNLLSDTDLVDPNLSKEVLTLPSQQRYSFIRYGSGQAIDHALTSAATDHWVRGFEYGRGNADAAFNLIDDPGTLLRCSDHDALVLFLMTDRDGDGYADDIDLCPDDPGCWPVELQSFTIE